MWDRKAAATAAEYGQVVARLGKQSNPSPMLRGLTRGLKADFALQVCCRERCAVTPQMSLLLIRAAAAVEEFQSTTSEIVNAVDFAILLSGKSPKAVEIERVRLRNLFAALANQQQFPR